MSKLEFSMKLESSVEELMEAIMDFEKWPTFLPRQLKSVKILKKTENETTIEEILVFKTFVKNEIKQTSIYKKISDNSIHSQIISGHAKGTETNISFLEIESGVEVSVDIELKLSLKARFLSPIIKKVFKVFLQGILLKIDYSILGRGESTVV